MKLFLPKRVLLIAAVAACSSCKQVAVVQPVKHFAEIKTPAGRIFLDPFPVERVLKPTAEKGRGNFCSYKIGFESSQEPDSKAKAEWQRYVDYSMSKDWILVSDRDSLPVVFDQAVVRKSPKITESVLVFEVPQGASPLKMIYRDGFGHGEDKTFLLKSKTE